MPTRRLGAPRPSTSTAHIRPPDSGATVTPPAQAPQDRAQQQAQDQAQQVLRLRQDHALPLPHPTERQGSNVDSRSLTRVRRTRSAPRREATLR